MKLGDTIENAIWLDGRETKEVYDRYLRDVKATIDTAAEKEGFLVGPMRVLEKRPGEDRVPPVPDHIQGPDVRLLVLEADVVLHAPPAPV